MLDVKDIHTQTEPDVQDSLAHNKYCSKHKTLHTHNIVTAAGTIVTLTNITCILCVLVKVCVSGAKLYIVRLVMQ